MYSGTGFDILNSFCREVHEGCLFHDKNKSVKAVHICSSHQFGLEVERPERSTTFSLFYYFIYNFT